MIGLKNMLDNLDISIHNIELHTVGREWNYRNVNNPYSRIYYITRGCARMRHHGRDFIVEPGQLYLIPCYTTVDMFCDGGFSHYYVHFNARIPTGLDILSILECNYQLSESEGMGPQWFERLLQLNPDKKLTDYDANKPIYRQVLDRARELDKLKAPGNILESNAIVRLMLAAFFRTYDHAQTANTLHGMARFENVLTYISEHLSEPVNLTKLARMANLSPTYFSNLFSQLMGISPLQYINKRRVEESQRLLLSTDDTLYKIARVAGFTDEYYFSRVFKKIIGVSPDHYRKQNLILHQRRSS